MQEGIDSLMHQRFSKVEYVINKLVMICTILI